jgi:SRSO17 transposase
VSDVAEVLVVFREQQAEGTWKHDYLLSNAVLDLSLTEFARVFKAEHRVEECLQRAKGEAGLADYEVRTWRGWYHHQALALVATWFLTVEARRGKKWTPASPFQPSSCLSKLDRSAPGRRRSTCS